VTKHHNVIHERSHPSWSRIQWQSRRSEGKRKR